MELLRVAGYRGIGLSIVALLLKKMNACVIAMARQKSDALAALEEEYRDRMEVTLGDMYVFF